jgi:hypothetical protein
VSRASGLYAHNRERSKLLLSADYSSIRRPRVSFTDEKGRLWAVDLGVDFGGDSFNVAIGFTYEI